MVHLLTSEYLLTMQRKEHNTRSLDTIRDKNLHRQSLCLPKDMDDNDYISFT